MNHMEPLTERDAVIKELRSILDQIDETLYSGSHISWNNNLTDEVNVSRWAKRLEGALFEIRQNLYLVMGHAAKMDNLLPQGASISPMSVVALCIVVAIASVCLGAIMATM